VINPLRVRDAPSSEGKELCILPLGQVITCHEIKGFWLRHDLGWSMIHSDPAKGEKKYFLQVLRKRGASPNPGKLAVAGVGATFEVVAPSGLRIRDAPHERSNELGILPDGKKIMCTDIQGSWMRHSLGWSLILSDVGGQRKVYLHPV